MCPPGYRRSCTDLRSIARRPAAGRASVQLDRNQLRHARFLHRHAVEAIGDFHRLAVVRDDDELRVLLHAAEHLDEAADVGIVERRIDLVEEAEGARLVLEHAEHQRDGGQRLLAAREQLDALQPLAGWLRDDLDAALERIGFVEQRQPGAAATEQRAERLLKIAIDGEERFRETLTRRFVDPPDRFARLRDRFDEIVALRRQEPVALVELVELLDRHHVHRTEPLDPAPQRCDRLLGAHRALLRDRDRIFRDVRLQPDITRRVLVLVDRLLGAQSRGVRNGLPRRFELLDLAEHLVERGIDGILAGVREVRQIAFGRRPRDVELRDDGADRVERAARFPDRGLALVARRAKRGDALVGAHDGAAKVVEIADVGVELPLAGHNRFPQLAHAAPRFLELDRERRGARFDLRRCFLEPLHFGRQRAGPLDERRVRRSRFGRATAGIIDRLARFEQPPLRDGQPLVGEALIVFQPRDRGSRFFPTPIERIALLFRLPSLANQLRGALRKARLFVSGVLELRFVADDRLFVLVVLGVERRDGVRRLRDRGFELCRLLREARQRAPLHGDAVAQLLDLAFGLEDATRFGARAARHERGTVKDFASERRDQPPRRAARVSRLLIRRRDPRVANRRANGVGVRSVGAHHRRQGDHSVGVAVVVVTVVAIAVIALAVADGLETVPYNPRYSRRDQEAASSCAGFLNHPESRGGVLRTLDDDVLQEIAETRLDRPLVSRFHLEVIGDGAVLVDGAVRLRQDGPRSIAESGARRLELLERFQPRLEAGELVLGPSDPARRRLVRPRCRRIRRRGAFAFLAGLGRRFAARHDRCPGRFAPQFDRLELARHCGGPSIERLHLFAIERDLLLPAVDRQLPRVRRFARGGGARFRFDELDPHTAEIALDFRDARRRDRLALARLGEPRPRRRDGFRELTILAREEHLLPALQLVAEPLIPPRLRRLPLQRAALLLDLEDDVVDPREVLLCRLQLQLSGAPPRFVLCDARRFFDQLPPIGRT